MVPTATDAGEGFGLVRFASVRVCLSHQLENSCMRCTLGKMAALGIDSSGVFIT